MVGRKKALPTNRGTNSYSGNRNSTKEAKRTHWGDGDRWSAAASCGSRRRLVHSHFRGHRILHYARTDTLSSHIDDYKIARSQESKGKGTVTTKVAASTINFEVTVLRSFFYYLIRERGVKMENPCAHFKMLRDAKERLKSKPQAYTRG